jgi:hypothetical protein
VTAGTGVPVNGIDHKKNGMGRYHPFATRQPQKHTVETIHYITVATFTSQGDDMPAAMSLKSFGTRTAGMVVG